MGSSLLARTFAACLLLAVLSGCESTEDKAERTYQEAVQLADSGDEVRALVSLRSVFKLNGEHREARLLYAKLQADRGNLEQAYSHYLLVSEQYPSDLVSRHRLGEIAIELGAWDEAGRHARAAAAIDPDYPPLQPVLVSVDYSDAVRNEDPAAAGDAVERARALVAEDPGSLLSRQVVIDDLVRSQRFEDALVQIDEAIELFPLDPKLNQLKLSILAQLEDMDELGAQLKVMVERFPENREVRTALVRWYLANGDADGAEAFVRDLVARSGDETAPRIALVQFLTQVRGPEAAIAELDDLIAEGTDDLTFRLLQASMLFDTGERADAIARVENLIDTSGDDAAEHDVKTTLARMLIADGDEVRARELVAEVLAAEAANPDALKLQANWLIEADQVRDAVLALRTALDQSPDDPETLTLLARAYERGGNRELMSESLALAFDASNAAPAEALRYARLLASTDRLRPAEDVLLRSLRLSPRNLQLLQTLSEVYLAMNDMARAEQVVGALRQIGTEDANRLATGIQAAILQRLERTDESISLIQSLAQDGASALGAQTAIIRTRLASGEIAEARAYMNRVLAETPPDSPERVGVEFLNAALTAAEGDFDAARGLYRDILSGNPESEPVWRALIATAVRQGDPEGAMQVVDEALGVLPESANLRWIKAGLAERAGHIDDAIEIYEALYADNTNSAIVANNLASMITTYRDDDESLERAYLIARRLRGSDIPAFQDTYGWIAFRLGNYDEALEHLEPAAAGLPNDPMVQYHAGRLYAHLERPDEARRHLERAIDLWDDAPLDIVDTARQALAALDAPADETGGAAVPVEATE